jgi:hypothetical protein
MSFKHIAIASSTFDLSVHIQNSTVIRSDGGVNSGVFFFSLDTEMCVVKPMHKSCAANILEADRLLSMAGLDVIDVTTIDTSSALNRQVKDKLNPLLTLKKGNGELVLNRNQRENLKGYLKSKDSVFFVMPFMMATPLDECLSDLTEKLKTADHFWTSLGKGFVMDTLTGNIDRYISVNLGNIMVTEDRVIFIDNNTDLGFEHDRAAVEQLQNPAEKLYDFSVALAELLDMDSALVISKICDNIPDIGKALLRSFTEKTNVGPYSCTQILRNAFPN